MTNQCESCNLNVPLQTLHSATPGHVFDVCTECAGRIRNYTLSSLNWLNLASVHSSQVLELHDDFYNQHGESQAKRSIRGWRVRDFRGDVSRLFDVLIAWNGELDSDDGQQLLGELKQLHHTTVAAEVDKRLVGAKHSNVCRAILNASRYSIFPNNLAASLAVGMSQSVRPDNLYEWVRASVDRLPWAIVRDKFFGVIQSIDAAKRRFELVTLKYLIESQDRTKRKMSMAEFLSLLPPIDVAHSLARYVDLVDAEDLPKIIVDLLDDKHRGMHRCRIDGPDVSRSDSQYWAWGQIAAVCDPSWVEHFFGENLGRWRVVCSACEVAQGHLPNSVCPAVHKSLGLQVDANEHWSRLTAKLKSVGLWVDP
jgi:hypothetical protein